ncbi:uncharacterized protein [Epargyreus clarus]|uniref:uncharacterized protein n=1 Tax=Epargyreus clarus TaxID=520877 RepID=UPI003C2D67D0
MAMRSEQLIANEVLAFIQHAIDTMDEVSIIQISKSNFTREEIGSAKILLFESLGMSDRMPSRRKDEKGEKGLQDIINLLKVIDPDDLPAFVAKNIHKLPPVTYDHVDVTRLLKDITALKTSLAEVVLKLEASQDTISDLRAEVATLRNTVAVSRSPEVTNINTRRGACHTSSASFESAKLDTTPTAALACGDTCVTRPAPPPAEVSPCVVMSTPQRDYAAAASRQLPGKRKTTRPERESGKPRIERPRSEVSNHVADKDGFIKVERKRKKPPCRNQCGTAPTGADHVLRPAVPVTLVYVSRLHYNTKPSDVVEYLATNTNTRLVVEKLEARIQCERCVAGKLGASEFRASGQLLSASALVVTPWQSLAQCIIRPRAERAPFLSRPSRRSHAG